MSATGNAAKESLHPSANWSGLCLKFVRTQFGLVGRYPSAYSAWLGAGGAKGVNTHTLLRPPANVPVFWSGGPHGYGHVAIADGQGRVWSTDILRKGKVDLVPLATIHAKWGLKYLGWTETLNGIRVSPHVDYHG